MNPRRATQVLATIFAAALLLCSQLAAQESGMLGFWKEPTGSVIHIDHCGPENGQAICATLVFVRPNAPTRVDSHNPDPTLHTRSLCGLRIGQDFHLASPGKAEGGTLYDPKSGKTYRGTMSSSGDQLNLRGYVGIPLFGRSETWTRTSPLETCKG
jgi:uncharacterized protein (DUF2147 family)